MAASCATAIGSIPVPRSWSCPWCASEFRALGTSLHQSLNLRRVDPTYRLVFDDGTDLMLTSDMSRMHAQLEAIEPEASAAFVATWRRADVTTSSSSTRS